MPEDKARWAGRDLGSRRWLRALGRGCCPRRVGGGARRRQASPKLTMQLQVWGEDGVGTGPGCGGLGCRLAWASFSRQ